MDKRWQALILAVILLLALKVRMGLFLSASGGGAFQTPDTEHYVNLASAILDDKAFARYSWRTQSPPEIFRTPGYPVFIIGGQEAGETLGLWGPYQSVVFCQLILDVALVGLTFWLGLLLVAPWAGLVAALLQAISPLAVASSCRLVSDSLYALCFTASLVLLIKYMRSGRWWMLAASGVVLGLSCYVRPVAIVMAGVIGFFLLLWRGRKIGEGLAPVSADGARSANPQAEEKGIPSPVERWGKTVLSRFGRAGIFVGVFLACLAPWVLRNIRVADYYGFSSFSSDAMYSFAAADVIARTEGIDGQTGRDRLKRDADEYAERPGVTVGDAARWRQRKAWEIIGQDPWLYAKIHAKGCLGFWLPGATDVLEIAGLTQGNRDTLEVLKTRGLGAAIEHYFGDNVRAIALAAPMVAFTLVQYVAALICAARGVRRKVPLEAWMLAAIVLVSSALPGPFGLPRYRLPVEPILNIAAAVGLLAFVSLLRRRWAGPLPSNS